MHLRFSISKTKQKYLNLSLLGTRMMWAKEEMTFSAKIKFCMKNSNFSTRQLITAKANFGNLNTSTDQIPTDSKRASFFNIKIYFHGN